jgi:phosphoribosylformylglycinamidine synthase
MNLVARWNGIEAGTPPTAVQSGDLKEDMLHLLRRLNICSKEYVVRQYDHEVQGGSVVKPLCGVKADGPSDAAVIRPLLDSFEGVVVSNGIAPRYSDIDTYAMTCCVIDEAVRNAVCVGADPDHMAGLDNFCWCDPITSPDNPDGEYKLAQLVRANQALHDTCVHYGVPLISGKDSMKNDYRIGDTKISIPPTLLFSVVARMGDVRRAVTMDLKEAGNALYIIGTTYRDLGKSEYAEMRELTEMSVPQVRRPRRTLKCYRLLHTAINEGLVRTCHDLSDGGLAVAVTEMCFSGELGVTVDLRELPQSGCQTDTELLFSESPSRILVELRPEHAQSFEALFTRLPCARIGETMRGDTISFTGLEGLEVVSMSRIDAKAAWKSTFNW